MVCFQSCSLFRNRVLTCGSLAFISFVVSVLLSTNSFADTKVWVGNGGNANLNNPDNWSGGAAPETGDAWEFGAVGTSGYVLTNDIPDGTSNSGITFTEDAIGSYTISGHWTRQTGDIVNNSSFAQTLNLGHELHDNVTVNAASGDINILQNNTININKKSLTFTGSHTTTLGLTLYQPGNANGTFTVKDTTLRFNRHDIFGTADVKSPVNIIVDGGTVCNNTGWFNTFNHLTLKNGGNIVDNGGEGTWLSFQLVGECNVTSDSALAANKISTISIGTEGGLNGVIPYGVNFNVANVTNNASTDLLVSARLRNSNGGRVGTFTKSGAGTMELTNVNDITGSITISGGVLKLSGNGTLGTGSVANNANLEFAYDSEKTVANVITGSGSVTKSGAETLTLSGANTYTGVTTVSGGTLKITGSTFNSRLIIGNGSSAVIDAGENGVVNMNADGYNSALMIGNGSVGSLTLESGNVTIHNSSSSGTKGGIQLGTNNNGKGELTINGGTMQVDSRILIGANSGAKEGTLNMNGGTLTLGVPGSYTTSGDPSCGVLWFGYNKCTVNLNGGTIAMYGVRNGGPNAESSFNFNGGTIQAVANNNVDFFPAAGNMKYYVKQGGAAFDTQGFNVTVGAKLEQGTGENDGEGGFTKLGTGTLTLSQAPAYTGATTVSAGTLKLSEGGTLYNLSGGSLDANGQIAVAVTLDSTGKALTLSNSDITKFIGSISASSIIKTGDGTMQIYTGAEGQVDAQSLVVSSGRMDIKGYMTGGITVDAEAVFSPGNSVGEAVFGGNYILSEGATLLIEQDATGMDKLTASSFEIDPNAILELSVESAAPGATYPIIVKSSGAFDGGYENDSFWNDLLTPDSAYFWNLKVDGNTVFATLDANAVPEPSTWALMILGAAGLLYWRKRK